MGISRSFLWAAWLSCQKWQDSTFSLISLEIPGLYTDKLARARHFVMPWCPVWMRSNVSSLIPVGITMRSSYVRRPTLIDRCPRQSKNSRTWSGTSSTLSGHPCNVSSIAFWNCASLTVASLILFIWLSVAGLVDSVKATKLERLLRCLLLGPSKKIYIFFHWLSKLKPYAL